MLNRLTYLWKATFCGPFFKSYLGEIDFTFYTGEEYENQGLAVTYASWVQGLTVSAPSDGWVKTSVEFVVDSDALYDNYNNMYPWLLIEYWRNQGGSVYLDEVQMYLVEE